MSLSGLLDAALPDPALTSALDSIGTPSLTISGPAALRPFVIATVARQRTVLAVTSTGAEAEDLAAVLRRLAHPTDDGDPTTGPLAVVVAPIRSVLQPQVSGLGDLEPVALRAGDGGRELTDIAADLVAAGYARGELVEKRGDFAVRGGILDVFPPTEEHPLRVAFWGDEIEEIRYFKVADQRSLEVAEHGL